MGTLTYLFIAHSAWFSCQINAVLQILNGIQLLQKSWLVVTTARYTKSKSQYHRRSIIVKLTWFKIIQSNSGVSRWWSSKWQKIRKKMRSKKNANDACVLEVSFHPKSNNKTKTGTLSLSLRSAIWTTTVASSYAHLSANFPATTIYARLIKSAL